MSETRAPSAPPEPSTTIDVEVSGWFTDTQEAKAVIAQAILGALNEHGLLRWRGLGVGTSVRAVDEATP